MRLARGDKGAAVAQLQRDLVELGIPLPRYGVDGDLGDETLLGVSSLLRKHARTDADPLVVSADELQLISELVVQLHAAPDVGPAGVVVHDRRATASQHLVIGPRRWAEVTGITMHHTACLLGVSPARWDSIGCHIGIPRNGDVIQLHDLNKEVIHGHGLNRRTVGIEHDGWYEGVCGRPDTLWQPRGEAKRFPMVPTPEMIGASCATIRWICATVAAHGGKVRFLLAHRQASSERQADPGELLWKAIALPMMEELGLTHGDSLAFKIDSGYPIPESWDPRCVGQRY